MPYIGNAKIVMLKGERGDTGAPTDEQVQAQLTKWLAEHPDATIDETIIRQATSDVVNASAYKDELYVQVLAQAPSEQKYTEFTTSVDSKVSAIETTVNEVETNTEGLQGITFITDDSGEINGYRTEKGGADTVFPFNAWSLLWKIEDEGYTDTSFVSLETGSISIPKIQNYKYIMIECGRYNPNSGAFDTLGVKTSSESSITVVYSSYTTNSIEVRYRTFTKSENEITFGSATTQRYNGELYGRYTSNTFVPIRVWGIGKINGFV